MRYITQHLPHLTSLSVAGCWKLTDAGWPILFREFILVLVLLLYCKIKLRLVANILAVQEESTTNLSYLA